jgi:Rieske 2Fe-2S family protein
MLVDEPTYLLDPEAYLSEAWFAREQRELFGRVWLFAGLDSDLPGAGDYITLQAGDTPVAVVRQKDGTLAAFHNICRHRGARIVEGQGNVSSGLSCFYHRWHYNLDGSLRGLPQAEQFPSVMANKGAFGLHRASVDSWNGMIFVNAEAEPEADLRTWLDRVPDLWGPWRPGNLFELPRREVEVLANWKLFIENHIDGYHLWHLHAQTVRGLDHAQQRWEACGSHWMFYEPELVPGTMPDRAMYGLPMIAGVDETRYGSSVFMLFPNIGGAGGVTFFSIFTVEPLAAERTRVTFRTFIKPLTEQDFVDNPELGSQLESSLSASGKPLPASASFEERLAAAAQERDFIAEDKLAVEAIQAAMRSRHFSVGPLARDFEASIPFFQQSVLRRVPLKSDQ